MPTSIFTVSEQLTKFQHIFIVCKNIRYDNISQKNLIELCEHTQIVAISFNSVPVIRNTKIKRTATFDSVVYLDACSRLFGLCSF